MSSNLRRRLVVVAPIIVVTSIIVAAVLLSTTSSRTLTVAEAASGRYNGQRVQVTGQVVSDSYSFDSQNLIFSICDPAEPNYQLCVIYDGPMSATFGNQVTAICTGTLDTNSVLIASELITKCPSKYESSGEALSISELFAYGDAVVDVPVKVTGTVLPGSLTAAGGTPRLILLDEQTNRQLPVMYPGGLPDQLGENSEVIATGSLNNAGAFVATDIALGR